MRNLAFAVALPCLLAPLAAVNVDCMYCYPSSIPLGRDLAIGACAKSMYKSHSGFFFFSFFLSLVWLVGCFSRFVLYFTPLASLHIAGRGCMS